jgi:uncharacterized membrane protein
MLKATTDKMPSLEEMQSALVQTLEKLKRGKWFTHSSYAGFLLLMSWQHFAADSGVKLWLVKIIPLLIFIPGFIKEQYRTYSWLCFAVLPYFIWLTPLVMGRGSLADWVMILLIVVLFIGAMMTSRWLQQRSYLTWQIANTPNTEPTH